MRSSFNIGLSFVGLQGPIWAIGNAVDSLVHQQQDGGESWDYGITGQHLCEYF